ncbi:uncharacterized protein BROUX77_003193 [Berkeleyomyces rouxiae]|uniref:uncharacterized protein n=1 Tax=Berkeleyomyces rouxiae TaxID=2035830 RepID=UPI003B78D112
MPLSVSSIITAAFATSQIALALPPVSDANSSLDLSSQSPGALSIKQTRSLGSSPDSAATIANVYHKYGVPIPRDLEATMTQRQKRDSTFAFLWTTLDSALIITARIGLSQDTFDFIFDTASTGLWLVSQAGTTHEFQRGYIPGGSHSSVKMEDYSWSTNHLDEIVSPQDVYKDIVFIGPTKNPISSGNQAIQVAGPGSGFESLGDISGVMGMGFASRNRIEPDTEGSFLDNIMKSLDDRVFTVEVKHDGIGEVNFGFIDHERYTGEIGFSDVLSDEGYWNFTVGGLVSDKTPDGEGIEYAIADTGSPFVMLPMPYISAYYKEVAGARYSVTHGGFVYPCATKLPDFTFDVGGIDVDIPGEYLKHSVADTKQSLCLGGLQSSNELGLNVIGSIGFKTSVVIFDPVDSKIGWAKKRMTW